MRIGNIEARPGEHAFGYLEVAKSRSGLSPEILIHLFVGAEPGPTLLLQGAIHGAEIIGTMAMLNLVKKLDPRKMRGNLIAVPVTNRVGFELQDRGSKIDGKDISRLFPGNPKGSVSEQVAHVYFEEVIRKANVMIDFHAGALIAYERYVLFTAEGEGSGQPHGDREEAAQTGGCLRPGSGRLLPARHLWFRRGQEGDCGCGCGDVHHGVWGRHWMVRAR